MVPTEAGWWAGKTRSTLEPGKGVLLWSRVFCFGVFREFSDIILAPLTLSLSYGLIRMYLFLIIQSIYLMKQAAGIDVFCMFDTQVLSSTSHTCCVWLYSPSLKTSESTTHPMLTIHTASTHTHWKQTIFLHTSSTCLRVLKYTQQLWKVEQLIQSTHLQALFQR